MYFEERTYSANIDMNSRSDLDRHSHVDRVNQSP